MRSAPLLAGLLGPVLLLAGCVTTYVPAPGEKMVTVYSVGSGMPQICKGGKIYWPEFDNDRKEPPAAFKVPAGERLTVGAHLTSEGYRVIYYCKPFLSFIPAEGQSYFLNNGMSGDGRCFVELARADVLGRNGLSPEPSVGPTSCASR